MEIDKIKEIVGSCKRYGLDDDGGCSDPECCGGRDYYIGKMDDGEYIKIKELLRKLNRNNKQS